MKDAQQLQAGVDRMFPSARPLLKYRNNAEGYVIVPAHYLASLQEDRALWDAVEAHEVDLELLNNGAWQARTVNNKECSVNTHESATPREAVAKARDAIELND